MTSTSIELGYEIGTGAPVSVPVKHTCITGQSQEAGKTTALEAMVERSGRRAVTFITKRGEGSFRSGRALAPYFRPRADWQYVASLIDATMGEKNKILRSWLMKVCRNTKTLAEVQANVKAAKDRARGFSESIYTEIEGYLELVVPLLATLPAPAPVVLGPGVNVMDLSSYPVQLQALVIPSVLEYVYERESEVITVIPEAWEFLPEGRGSPVKLAARTLLRKGAAVKNYLWIDSQDLGGVDKEIIRGCPILMIGVQREANEIKRTLANIPAGVPRIKPADLQALKLGQFFVCFGQSAIATYIRPSWAVPIAAREAAIESRPLEGARDRRQWKEVRDLETKEVRDLQELERESEARERTLREILAKLERLETEHHREHAARVAAETKLEEVTRENVRLAVQIEALERRAIECPLPGLDLGIYPAPGATGSGRSSATDLDLAIGAGAIPPGGGGSVEFPRSVERAYEREYQYIKRRLLEDAPELLKVVETRPAVVVEIQPNAVTIDGATLRGRVARLIAAGWFGTVQATAAVRRELARTGADPGGGGTLAKTLGEFVRDGFLLREGSGFLRAPGLEVSTRVLRTEAPPI